MTESELLETYLSDIKPHYLNRVKVSEKKTCIFLAGQPGCGKTELGKAAIKLLENKSAVSVSPDDLRKFHKDYRSTPEDQRYSKLYDDTMAFRKMVYEDVIKEGKNIIFDGTFSMDNKPNEALMDQFKKAGYEVNIVALSVNETVSKIGVNYRCFKESKMPGRFVPYDIQDKTYNTIPDNIKSACEKNLADNVFIYGRRQLMKQPKEPNLIAKLNSSQIKEDSERPVNAYITERTRPFTKKELESYKDWAANTAKLIVKHNGNVNDFKEGLLKKNLDTPELLKNQINEIANSLNQYLKHDKNMESNLSKEENKKEIVKITGNLGQDATVKTLESGKIVATFAIADNTNKEAVKWHNVQVWGDNIPKDALLKGQKVELEGYFKKFKTISGEKEEFVANKVNPLAQKQSENVKERVTLKGHLGQDPEILVRGDKKVGVFSLAIKKEGSDTPTWQQVQLWENTKANPDKIQDMKKGDFVEIKGYYGNEYTNSKGETKKDFILEESTVLKAAEKQEEKKSGGMKI